MNTPLDCERTLLVQADFDGELDPAEAAALVQHMEGCGACQAVREQLVVSRDLLRSAPKYTAPDTLRARLARSREKPASRPNVLVWSVSAAAAAIVATVLLSQGVGLRSGGNVASQLVSNHLRAMQLDSHLIDVESSDHHTVKPWFAGKVDFAPTVKELAAEGYVLKGGRLDVVDGQPAAVLVYQAGRHVVDVYMWPTRGAGTGTVDASQVDGFNLRRWADGDLWVWCVSDLGVDEMNRFVDRWRAAR